jgi:hypothetical protein
VQPSDQYVEPDAVAADDDEIGKMRPVDQLHLDRFNATPGCGYLGRDPMR